MKKLVFHIIFAFSLAFGLQAQSEYTPYYFILGKEELANVNVYSIYYDEKTEILFVGTNKGLFQYSQSKFHKIATPKVAIGNSFFSLKKNKKGQLFCSNINGQIFKVYPNKIELYHSIPIKDIQSRVFDYQFDEQNRLWCYSSKLWLITELNGSIKTRVIAENINSPYNIQFHPNNRLLLFVLEDKSKKKIPKVLDPTFSIEWKETARKGFSRILEEGHVIYYDFKGKYEVAFGQPQKKIQFTFPFHSIHSALEPLNDSMFLATGAKQGIAIGTIDEQGVQFSKTLFQNRFISTVFLCTNKILLLGTFKNGIIVIPNLDFQGVSSNFLYTDIAFHDADNVLTSTYAGNVYAYHIPKQKEEKVMSSATNINHLFITSSPFSNLKKLPYLFKKSDYFRDAVELKKGLYAVANPSGLSIVFSDKQTIKNTAFVLEGFEFNRTYDFFNKSIFFHQANKLESDTIKQLLYLSTSEGLFQSSYAAGADFSRKIKILDEFVNDIHFADGKLFCATNNGVFILKNDKVIQHIHIKNGLFSNQTTKLNYNNNLLFILSFKGIQVYDLQQKTFIKMGLEANLLGSDVVNFALSKSHLAILRKSDYFLLPLNSFYQPVEISNSYIDSILVNDRPTSLQKTTFSHTENSFTFFLDYRDIQTKFRSSIEYQLSGITENWKPLPKENHRVEFLSLPVGQYTFSVRTIYQNTYSPISSYTFTIHPPYWQQWWFYLLIVVFSAGGIGLMAWYRLQAIEKKAAQKIEIENNKKMMLNAQLKAIRSQMNPHFIFNSLNSIQDMILEQDTNRSYDTIVLFSRLVRNALKYSQKEFLFLSKEIEFLEIYLKLEELRLGGQFTYSIEKKFNKNIKIPSMIIQPFVENALLHGLMHKEGDKRLDIHFELKENLICTITDNGIGRKKAQAIKKRQKGSHESFSTRAIKERLEVLSKQYHLEVGYIYVDLMDNETAKGTKVLIQLPYKEF